MAKQSKVVHSDPEIRARSARVNAEPSGFAGVSIVAAAFTLLIPVSCIWLRER